MKEIPLSQGKVALVDDADYERVSALRWCYHPKGYATSSLRVGKKVQTIYLHRFVMNTTAPNVDHRDRNKLNCQKDNLRIATHSQNNANCGRRSHNTSGYKGVCRHPKNNTWQVKIGYQRKTIYLGCHPDLIEAAKMYDDAARKLYGEFASTNF